MAALNRITTCTNTISRLPHRIALEEAILPTSIPLNETIPPVPQVDGVTGAVLSPTFTEDVGQRLTDASLRLESMDASEIRYAIVSRTSPSIEGVSDAATAVAYARRVSDEMHATYVSPHPTRFGFFACLPMQDPPTAAAELERSSTGTSEHVLWSVDYPYGSNEDAADGFDSVEGLEEETKRKIMWRNAERIFGVPACGLFEIKAEIRDLP